MKRALSVLLLLVAVSFVGADGPLNADGYSWNGTYYVWPADGTQWRRTTTQYYDRYSCCYRTQYTYVYAAPPYVAPVAAAPVINYKSPTWKEELVKAMNDREERHLFDKSMQAFGQSSTVPQLNYGYANGNYLQRSVTQYGASGTTLYSHAAITTKDVWGDTSPAQLFQQLGNLTKNQQELSGTAVAAFAQLVGDDSAARGRIAELLANRDLAVAVINAAKTQQTVTKEYKIEQGTQPNGPPPGAAAGQLNPQNFEKRVEAQCASCHLGDKLKGGFNLTSLPSLDNAGKLKVWLRLNHSNPNKRMPLAGTDGPGTPQTPQELEEWRQYLFGMPAAKE